MVISKRRPFLRNIDSLGITTKKRFFKQKSDSLGITAKNNFLGKNLFFQGDVKIASFSPKY